MLAVLIALTAIVGVPSAFAEIEVGNYGFTQMKNANLAFNTALDQFLVKIVEMANAINDNTAAITELQNTSGSDNQVQVDQNSVDIQTMNATVFWNEGLLANNMGNTAQNTAAITDLQNNPATPGIYHVSFTQNGGDFQGQDKDLTVLCDTGDTVLGGGFTSDRFGEPSGSGSVLESIPIPDLSGWQVFYQNNPSSSTDYTVSAVCMDSTP